MVVTNKMKMVRKMNFLFTILILLFCITAVGFVFKSLIKYNLRWPLLILMLILKTSIFTWIKNLKVFQFENIGSTFTIKYYHPLKTGIIFPYIEFPIKNINRYTIEKRLLEPNLLKMYIMVKEKPIHFNLKVSHLSNHSYEKIENSLKLAS